MKVPVSPKPPTHYIRWDAPGSIRPTARRRALCGTAVENRKHDNNPTCTTCARLFQQLNEDAP